MKFFAVLSSVLASVAAEAHLPIASQYLGTAGLYSGYGGIAAPYAAAYAGDVRFAYGTPVTALNAGPLTAGPVAAGPHTDGPVAVAAPFVGAQYAAAYAAPAIAAAPAVAVAAAPAVAVAPVAYETAPIAPQTSSQFQAQDEIGNIAYGYQNINSAKQERGNIYGGVEGSYSYVDEAGIHTVNYVADDFGFRVIGDNLPLAPVHEAVAPVFTGVAPVAVADTPAVVEAKAAFFAAYDAVAHRERRSAQGGYGYGIPTAYAAPVATYGAAPAVREAVLTTIKLNPGHAVFYRVD